MWPTPQAIDSSGNGREPRLKKDCNRDPNTPGSWRADLKDVVPKDGGQLNPDWVELLMGFSVGFTDIDNEFTGDKLATQNWQGDWEAGVPRVATGVKNRVGRLKCLGNAVVPAVVEQIGRAIVEVEAK